MKKLLLLLSGFIIVSALVGCVDPSVFTPPPNPTPDVPKADLPGFDNPTAKGKSAPSAPSPAAPPAPVTTPVPSPATPGPSIRPPVTLLPPTPAPTPVSPSPAPVSKPTATPALSAARDLTGTWTGTGTYSMVTAAGKIVANITANIEMYITKEGDNLRAEIRLKSIKQAPEKTVIVPFTDKPDYSTGFDPGYFDFISLDLRGIASASELSLTSLDRGQMSFSFTSDLMSGGGEILMGDPRGGPKVNVPFSNVRYSLKSDPKAFNLTRQK